MAFGTQALEMCARKLHPYPVFALFLSRREKMSLYSFKPELLDISCLTQALVNAAVYCGCHLQKFVVAVALSLPFHFQNRNNGPGQCCHLEDKLISAKKCEN